jgi:hypothetical protein
MLGSKKLGERQVDWGKIVSEARARFVPKVSFKAQQLRKSFEGSVLPSSEFFAVGGILTIYSKRGHR